MSKGKMAEQEAVGLHLLTETKIVLAYPSSLTT